MLVFIVTCAAVYVDEAAETNVRKLQSVFVCEH